MNSFSLFAFLLCFALTYCAPADPKDHYTTKYDNFKIDDVLKSKRLVKSYVDCVVQNQGCTAEGKTLKEYLPDALKTSCAKCTEKQRTGAIKVLTTLEKDHKDQLKRVLDKFDPDRKQWDQFKKTHALP